jgi:glycosyltransferase involved in cell wall biosynthesis
MKIQLHDFIGNHSGMHLYIESFRDLLVDYNIETSIHSNYHSLKTKKSYPNIFNGSLLKKVYLLLICYMLFFYNCLKQNKKDYIIVSIFGTKIDLVFLAISCLFKNKIILDVHEVMIMGEGNETLNKLYGFIYRNCSNKLISHSIKTQERLTFMGYRHELIKIPHIHYSFEKDFDILNVAEEIRHYFIENKKYFLFFGNIVSSKGVSDLLSAVEIINNENSEFRIIIAGKDSSKIIHHYHNSHLVSNKIKFILRYINDDEMKYLFENSHYVLLPYRDIYQSGVLEMAVRYKKPILTSDINYFKNILLNYPSFGKAIDTKNHHLFSDEILQSTNSISKEMSYTNKDLYNYFRTEAFDDFIDKLSVINKENN